MTKIRVALVGSGWVAQDRYLPSLKESGLCDVVAIADHRPTRRHSVAQRFNIPQEVDSHGELIASGGVDVLVICTPPETHYAIAREAIAAGLDVLVEKPLTTTFETAGELAHLAEERGRIGCVAHNFLFSSSARRAASMIEQGQTGRVLSVFGIQLSSERRRLPTWYASLRGGLFFDEAPHLVYLLDKFAGPMSVVHSRAMKSEKGSKQPIAYVDAVLAGERAPAFLSMNFQSPISEWHLVLAAEQCVLDIDLFRDTLIVQRSDGKHGSLDVLRSSAGVWLQSVTEFARSGFQYSRGRLRYGHEILISAFLDAVNGVRSPPVSLDDGARVVGLMSNIAESAGF